MAGYPDYEPPQNAADPAVIEAAVEDYLIANPPAGSGDVVGPATATDGAVALYDGTTGKLLQDGVVLGTAATSDTGDFDAAGTAAALVDDLSGVSDQATARTNLGLGSAAVAATSDFAAASHNHAASAITSGTVDTARLGSGTANSTTFLRGDQTWATPAGGGTFTVNSVRDQTGTYGLPGQSFRFLSTGSSRTVGWIFLYPFYVDAGGEDFDAWENRVETGQTSAVCDMAAYSVQDWMVGRTATKVSGTEVTGVNIATSGTKTATLGATKSLTEGYYWAAIVAYGSASAVTMWASQGSINLDNQISQGLGGLVHGIVTATGATSLPSTLTVANLASVTPSTATSGTIPICMRRP